MKTQQQLSSSGKSTKRQPRISGRLQVKSSIRGGSHPPQVVEACDSLSTQMRVLTIQVHLNWKEQKSKDLYNRLRELGWQAARYRNCMLRAKWAEAMAYRIDKSSDKHSVSKAIRHEEKAELSGDAYSCAEQEVQAIWGKFAKRILAGAPLPEWKTTAALSISGKTRQEDSGVRIEKDGEWYCLRIRAQAATCFGGSWLSLPLKYGHRRDEFAGPLLQDFSIWKVPIKKATVHLYRSKIKVRLSYPLQQVLPAMGSRVATFGPVDERGGLLLRTEIQTRDYTSNLSLLLRRKEDWEKIRRRVMAQIGRRKGHARTRRRLLARMSWDDWLKDHLHRWSSDVVDWCDSQGVGVIQIAGLSVGDWPAFRLRSMLEYKAAEVGIVVKDLEVLDAGAERAVKSIVQDGQKKAKRRRDAVAELKYQLAV